jgi:hypothetical protein
MRALEVCSSATLGGDGWDKDWVDERGATCGLDGAASSRPLDRNPMDKR